MSGRAGCLCALAAVAAVAGCLLIVRPITSPWWSGGDADSVYVSSAVSLAGGRPTRYFDHPGTPLQEALAATLEARWLVAGDGSRGQTADATFRHLDVTRPYFRGWAILFYFVSVLTVALCIGLLAADWLAGTLAGLLFLAAPQVLEYSIEFRPDVILGAIAVGIASLLIWGMRRRSAALYLLAAALLGFGVTVKLHTIGMLLPLVLAVALAPPPRDWAPAFVEDFRRYAYRRRRPLLAVATLYVVALVLLNLGSAGAPEGRVVSFVAAAISILVVALVAFRKLSRTRVRRFGTLIPALTLAAAAGGVLPNLFYAGTVPTMVRWVAVALIGHGVNSDAAPLKNGLADMKTWIPYAILTVLGLARALKARDREALVWGSAVAAMATLAAARFATPHYFIPAVALSIPLVLRGVAGDYGRAGVLAVVATALLLVIPFRDGIRLGQDSKHGAVLEQRLNGWARAHLAPRDAALTTLGSSDATYNAFVVPFTVSAPHLVYRMLPFDRDGAAIARDEGLHIRYVVHDPGAQVDLAQLGLRRVKAPPGAPAGVEAVAEG